MSPLSIPKRSPQLQVLPSSKVCQARDLSFLGLFWMDGKPENLNNLLPLARPFFCWNFRWFFVGKKYKAWPKFDFNGACGQRWAGVVLTRCTGTGDEPLEIYRPCAPCRTGASCTCRTLSEQPHYAQQCARWVQVATLDFKATIEAQISQNGNPAM